MAEALPGGSGRPSGARGKKSRRRSTSTARSARRKPASGAARRPSSTSRSAAKQAAADASRANNNNWLEAVLSVVTAPLTIAQSQTELLVSQLEKTGSLGQREGERVITEIRAARERAQGRAEQEAGRLDRFIESKIEDVLNRINIPSRTDIERLNHSVDILTAKVEALVSRQERGGTR
jgi:poly(hydroxyalkanoate) granule-associated protein